MMLYEDALAKAELAPEALAKGHILITPKRDVQRISDLTAKESAHLFTIASYTAAILFQGLKAEGTNIIASESETKTGTLAIHVLARRQEDGLSLQWPPQKLDEPSMKDVAERIRDKTFGIGRRESAAPIPEAKMPVRDEQRPGEAPSMNEAEIREAEDAENYLIKQLIRIP